MKVICIVQARMGSERLPGKVIKSILGKPMILYTLDRLSKSKYIDKIILATSDKKTEKPLIDICEKEGYQIFRGDEVNVLKRYKDAVDYYTKNNEEVAVVRVTGDCPFVDPVIVDNVITNFIMYNYDYVRLDVPNTFIRGFDVEVFSREALNKVFNIVNGKNNNSEYDMYKEHVTLYMYKHSNEFKIGNVKGEQYYKKDYRLCVDTIEDFNLVKDIFKHFKNNNISSKQIVSYIDDNPVVNNFNNKIIQKHV